MSNSSRSWTYFLLSTGALAVCGVLVGMSKPSLPSPPTNLPSRAEVKIDAHPDPTVPPTPEPLSARGFTSRELDAKDKLKLELQRRFTDKLNVDFGMARVIREGARPHFGPTMDRIGKYHLRSKSRKTSDGHTQVEIEGAWMDSRDVKPTMTPENFAEMDAIETLKQSGVDVALYTVGRFEADTGEKAEPRKSNGKVYGNQPDFWWGEPGSLRARGPAYTTQKSKTAPRAYEVVDFGRKAWASKRDESITETKDGWVFFANKVAAPDMSCAECHGTRKYRDRTIKGSVQKAGDPVGLFIIALHKD